MGRPASLQKVLPVRQAPAPTTKDAERIADRASEGAAAAREAQRKAEDPAGLVLDHSPFARDQSVTQAFGGQVISDLGGTEKLPRWRFSRFYFTHKAIMDLFPTQRGYDEAQVEERRAMAKRYGFRYAALGPNHSVLPHADKALRAKYASAAEQLGIG